MEIWTNRENLLVPTRSYTSRRHGCVRRTCRTIDRTTYSVLTVLEYVQLIVLEYAKVRSNIETCTICVSESPCHTLHYIFYCFSNTRTYIIRSPFLIIQSLPCRAFSFRCAGTPQTPRSLVHLVPSLVSTCSEPPTQSTTCLSTSTTTHIPPPLHILSCLRSILIYTEREVQKRNCLKNSAHCTPHH